MCEEKQKTTVHDSECRDSRINIITLLQILCNFLSRAFELLQCVLNGLVHLLLAISEAGTN